MPPVQLPLRTPASSPPPAAAPLPLPPPVAAPPPAASAAATALRPLRRRWQHLVRAGGQREALLLFDAALQLLQDADLAKLLRAQPLPQDAWRLADARGDDSNDLPGRRVVVVVVEGCAVGEWAFEEAWSRGRPGAWGQVGRRTGLGVGAAAGHRRSVLDPAPRAHTSRPAA